MQPWTKIEIMLEELRNHLDERFRHMSASIDTLSAEVTADRSVMSSAAKLIAGLAQRLTDAIAAAKAGDNHAALDALASDLAAGRAELAAAVTAGTVSDPAPSPDPTPAPAPSDPAAPTP